MNWLRAFWRDERATTSVEYAVMLALILAGVIGSISVFGNAQGGMWGGIRNDLDSAGFNQ